jgi:hypothetical protein
MLENVTRKNDVDQVVPQGLEVSTHSLNNFHAWPGVCPNILVRVQGNSTTTDNVVDELTIPSADIEDGVGGVDITLKEVSTEHLPDAVFSRLIFRTEPHPIEPRQLHVCTAPDPMDTGLMVFTP